MKKFTLLLLIAFILQSCFSMRQVTVQPELRRQHVGYSSISDIMAVFGQPNEEFTSDYGKTYVYYNIDIQKNTSRNVREPMPDDTYFIRDGNNNIRDTQITRFSFDENGIVRNVISDATVARKRFDGGATGACIFLGVVAAVGLPFLIIYIAADSAN